RNTSTMSSIYSQRVTFGPYEADLETHELWKNGIKLKLGGQPFEILTLLLRRPGQIVSREELQKEIWAADTFVDFNHGLNAAVNKLREALSDSAEEPKYIETLPRRGYRFIGKVEPLQQEVHAPGGDALNTALLIPVAPPTEALAREEVPASEEPLKTNPAEVSVPIGRKKSMPWRLRITGAIGVAALILLWWLAFSREPELRERLEQHAKTGKLANMLTLVPDPASDPAIS